MELPPPVKNAMADLPDQIDYNFHVKPIIADRCYACHGPDENKREANLRLDIQDNAYATLSSGAGHAIVPGRINRSQLIHRILSDDPEFTMPNPESNLDLDAEEIAILIKWIKQGAKYKPHWAFTKPEQPLLPKSGGEWARNEIDHFIAQKRERFQIKPSAEAQKEQLIRRLYFDLTGLPPTLEDLDQWITDPEPDYYDRLVDYLLTLPSFGERMAAHWLDVARFADSEGYLDDYHHTFWPYRDWVIKAFNENLLYDQFILWQIGGDQIPGATSEQILATAFNRNHKQNSEGGIIPEEFRVEYVADRTNTLGIAFMSLTVGCARCHDHKYDPFSQENYYELFSFFNSTIERGDGIFGLNAIENGQRVPNKLSMNSGPVLALTESKISEIRDFLLKQIDNREDNIQHLKIRNEASFVQWRDQQKDASALIGAVEKSTVSHLTFDDMADGFSMDLTPGARKAIYNGEIIAVPGKIEQAIRSNAVGQFVADGDRSSFERMEPFTISFWINTPKLFDQAHVMYNGNNRIQGYRGWDVTLDSSRLHFRLNHAHPFQSIDIYTTNSLPINEWVHFVWTYNGSSKAEGMEIYRNSEEIEFAIERDFLYRSTKPYTDDHSTVYMPYKGLIIGNRHYDQDFTGGLIDEVHILNREADDIVAKFLYNPDLGIAVFNQAIEEKTSKLDAFYDLFIDPQLELERKKLRAIQAAEIEAIDTVQEVMVMGDYARERPTFILDRGVYNALGQPVNRNVPESILPWPENLPKNRYGLGKWLIDDDHPMTARVAVNQFWYLMFGRGIVETVEDFGTQGALPTHPDLLDWLAVDFRENGWNVKRLVKQMVVSSTYRQSSQMRPELDQIDPDNLLLGRAHRYRRSAEMVRDNILAVSGLLNQQIGGPSAFPYQPDSLWKETTSKPYFKGYQIDYKKGLYRRSLYTFWKRNMPPPSMLIFDAASRAECQPRRQRSNTPLQALVLLNDPQFIEGSRALAEKVLLMSNGNIAEASKLAFRLLTSRNPTAVEHKYLVQQYDEELHYFSKNKNKALAYLDNGHHRVRSDLPKAELASLARVANTVLNSTEAYYKN